MEVKAQQVTPGKNYVIVNECSGKAISVQGGSKNNGASIVISTAANQPGQTFYVTGSNVNGYSIVSTNGWKSLDVQGISREQGAFVIQWDNWRGPNQRFKLNQIPSARSS